MTAQCGNCFYSRNPSGNLICAKSAPQAITDQSTDEPSARWLQVDTTWWCGEYSATQPVIYLNTVGPPDGQQAQCSNCFFAVPRGGQLLCSKIAPYSIGSTSDTNPFCRWLQVDPSWWCGDYNGGDPSIYGAPPQVASFSTGDVKLTIKTTPDAGWVMMDDGTIGDAASGASNRANADVQNLFVLIFTNLTDALAPLLTSSGGATSRAAQTNAATAWAANCRATLPRALGRALAVAGAGAGLTSRALGAYVGEESHTQTLDELVAHQHNIQLAIGIPSGSNYPLPKGDTGDNVLTDSAGGSTPFNVVQPTTFLNVMMML